MTQRTWTGARFGTSRLSSQVSFRQARNHWKRNKKLAVSVVMLCAPSRGTLEGAMHHGLRVTHRCREGHCQQPRGRQARHHTSYTLQCPTSIGELGLRHGEHISLLK